MSSTFSLLLNSRKILFPNLYHKTSSESYGFIESLSLQRFKISKISFSLCQFFDESWRFLPLSNSKPSLLQTYENIDYLRLPLTSYDTFNFYWKISLGNFHFYAILRLLIDFMKNLYSKFKIFSIDLKNSVRFSMRNVNCHLVFHGIFRFSVLFPK